MRASLKTPAGTADHPQTRDWKNIGAIGRYDVACYDSASTCQPRAMTKSGLSPEFGHVDARAGTHQKKIQ